MSESSSSESSSSESSSIDSSSSESSSSQSSSSESSSSSSEPCNGNTFQIRERLTDLPVVDSDENGTGLQYRRREVLDRDGRRIWSMDPLGFITRFVYDLATGAMVQRIDDVDTALAYDPPPGWNTPPGGGLNLITDYRCDGLGRTLMELGPAHEAQIQVEEACAEALWVRAVRFTIYRDDEHQTWNANGYARGNGPEYTYVTVGTVRMVWRDYAGRITDEIEAVRKCECGSLASEESFPRSTWRRWTHYRHDLWGRPQSTRVYHRIPLSGDGEEGSDYDETRYGYDLMGRQNRTVTPGGTITRLVRDSRGLVTGQWVGTNDHGASDDDPSGGGAPGNNMVADLLNEYDEGEDGGNGNLTKQIRPVDDESGSDRVVNHVYDFRDRLVQTYASDGSATFISTMGFDNLDRPTGEDSYHSTVSSGNLTGRSRRYYDSEGRVYREEIFAVNPDTGSVGPALVAERWYDPSGKLVQGTSPGSELITLLSYNSLGLETMRYFAFEPPVPPPSSSSSSGSSSSSSSLSSSSSSSSDTSSSSQSSDSSDSSSTSYLSSFSYPTSYPSSSTSFPIPHVFFFLVFNHVSPG